MYGPKDDWPDAIDLTIVHPDATPLTAQECAEVDSLFDAFDYVGLAPDWTCSSSLPVKPVTVKTITGVLSVLRRCDL